MGNNKKKSYEIIHKNIKEKIFCVLFKEYLESHEFEVDILKLSNEKDLNEKKIIDYIVNYFI